MVKPKFKRDDVVTVVAKDAGDTMTGVGRVTNVLRINNNWKYEVTFQGGRCVEVAENKIELRQPALFMDEMMKAKPSVQGAMLRLVLDDGKTPTKK